MTFRPDQLSDDLDEIARSLPAVPRAYSRLRQLLALLPNPVAASTQGSFPVADVTAPEPDPVDANQPIGTLPGSVLMDGAIKSGQLGPGAVTGAAFAATIKPVILVHGKPGLPNASYPVDTFIYDLDDTPAKTLWKNVANVWTRIIGAGDIQADSITAGQIAAGAVSTSELAVGARLTGEVANETGLTPGVFIDSTGILIRSGKLVLQDEFGLTTMQASGFTGSWDEYVRLGLYNPVFAAGATGSLPTGRTGSLPYWNIVKTGSPTLTRTADANYPGGYRCRATFSAINDLVELKSDKIPIFGQSDIQLEVSLGWPNITVGQVFFRWQANWYDASDVFISTDGPFAMGLAPGPQTAFRVGPLFIGVAPANARKVELVFGFKEITAHSGSNYGEIGSVWVTMVPRAQAIDELAIGPPISGDVNSIALEVTGVAVFHDGLRGWGAVFPTSPANNENFFRTDLGEWFRYDGTNWRCTVNHLWNTGPAQGSAALTATRASTHSAAAPPLDAGSDIWLVQLTTKFFVNGGTALGASHKWVGVFTKRPTGNSDTTIVTITVAAGSSSVWREDIQAIGALLNNGTAHFIFADAWTKTGTPGDFNYFTELTYNHVAT